MDPRPSTHAEARIVEALRYLKQTGMTPAEDAKTSAAGRRYLLSPLVVADPAWGETIPQWLMDAVKTARLGLVMAGETELASEEEAVAYLYTASLQAPLSHDWGTIYLVLSARVLSRWGRIRDPEEFWDTIGLEEPALTLYQKSECRRLRRDIRRSVERNCKRR